jgi:hypothetical protein
VNAKNRNQLTGGRHRRAALSPTLILGTAAANCSYTDGLDDDRGLEIGFLVVKKIISQKQGCFY